MINKNRDRENYMASYCELLIEKWNKGELFNSVVEFDKEYKLNTASDVKKLIKDIYKKKINAGSNYEIKYLINSWRTVDEYGENKTYVWIFHKTSETMNIIEEEIKLEEDINYYDYSPTGLWFGDEAKIIKLNDRIIVIKNWMLDC